MGRMKLGCNLGDSPALQLAHDPLDDPRNLFDVHWLTRSAAAERFAGEAFRGQEALELIAQLREPLLLDGRLRLAAGAGLNAA